MQRTIRSSVLHTPINEVL